MNEVGQLDLIVLTFREPLRGRELRPGYLPSDLLWGALYATDARLQGQPLPVDTPYRVSSAFPFVGDEWLLPKPRVSAAPAQRATGEASDKKKAKGLDYVRLTDFLTLAAGQRLTDLEEALAWQRRALLPVNSRRAELSPEGLSRSLRNTAYQGRADALARERYGAGSATQLSGGERLHLAREARGRRSTGLTERQRNAQDRVTQATETFVTAGLVQPQVAFLLDSVGDAQRTRLLAALRLLADSGLGGQRTQGSGQFSFEVRPVPDELRRRLNTNGPHVLLGLTHPTQEEAHAIDLAPQAQYALVRRDGYLDGTALQRKDVWMFAEGSLMPHAIGGKLADVTPDGHPHRVWRSGLALSVGVGA